MTLCLFMASSCTSTRPATVTSSSQSPSRVSPPVQPTSTEAPQSSPTPQVGTVEDAFAFEQNRRLGRGVNFGNALEAPREGEWGVVLQEDYFQIIKDGGFNAIRVPIRWNAHAEEKAPYTIDPVFFERIDWVVENAGKLDLAVILDLHHYLEMMESPAANKERFLAIWAQIAEHYREAPDSVYFELLNEPNGTISNTNTWNQILDDTVKEIRATNPRRTIIVGPGNWNSITSLYSLQLPEDDRNLIVTFHYYQPFQFTHQGAEWVDNSDPWLGTTWTATNQQKNAINGELNLAKTWSQRNRRPLFMGEFGAYSKADMDSRALWTSFMARAAEERGFSWAYWEFCAGFGVYDPTLKQWVEPLHKALIP